MRFILKSEADRRRAARLAQEQMTKQERPETTAPASPKLEAPAPTQQPGSAERPTKPEALKKAKRPKKAGRPKKQPTGDYDSGYCRPPVEHQFDGSKPGPGRPRGALSQDTIARKHLQKRRAVTVDGKTVSVTQRELIYMQLVNTALAGKDRQAISRTIADAVRLFPEPRVSDAEASSELSSSETSRAILEMFAEEIRQEQQGKSSPP